jgi:CheY-like chemotaxis protein
VSGYAEETYLSRRGLSNRKVLVVEDEMMIAMLIGNMLDEFGCKLIGPATNVPRTLDLIGKEQVDVAVLDLNLDGKDTYAIADALRQKNVPFIFATGYGSTSLRPEYGDRPVLQKPFQAKDLESALAEALSGSNAARLNRIAIRFRPFRRAAQLYGSYSGL